MARAETIESVGETGGGGNSPLPGHSTCRMELPQPFHTWPGLLTTATITTTGSAGVGAGMLPHHLRPLQALYFSYPLPYPHPEGQDEPQTHQQFPALSPSPSPTPPPSPPCNHREERGGGGAPCAFSGEQSDSERGEEHSDASSRLGPLPDLLPQNDPHPSMALRGEAAQELEIRRVAHQLRMIGDEYNATVLRRAHAAPHWQDWRDACRGLFNFITQTLSTLYRLT
ncbi:bcl-2-binding component 3 [Labrus bergylta]|uniref:bcl-2-binding component 3 n=1 Tax=Labrus bergylta TaxID=56723 RepID=UPI003313A5A6